METKYPALVHKDLDSEFGVSFPDFPGCVSAANTVQAALESAEAALAFHIEGMIEDGDPIPAPSSADEVLVSTEPDGLIGVMLVRAKVPGRSKRYNVSLPVDLVTRIDARTDNRSAFLAEAAEKLLAAG